MAEKKKYGMNREPGLQHAPPPLVSISIDEASRAPKIDETKWECDDLSCFWIFAGPAYLAYVEYGKHNNEAHSEQSRRIKKVK